MKVVINLSSEEVRNVLASYYGVPTSWVGEGPTVDMPYRINAPASDTAATLTRLADVIGKKTSKKA